MISIAILIEGFKFLNLSLTRSLSREVNVQVRSLEEETVVYVVFVRIVEEIGIEVGENINLRECCYPQVEKDIKREPRRIESANVAARIEFVQKVAEVLG